MGSVNGKVFLVMGPNNYQINSLGIFSGNDPVKNCKKQFTENFFPVGNVCNDNGRFSSYTLSLGQKCDGGHLF